MQEAGTIETVAVGVNVAVGVTVGTFVGGFGCGDPGGTGVLVGGTGVIPILTVGGGSEGEAAGAARAEVTTTRSVATNILT